MSQADAYINTAKSEWKRFVAWVTREEHKQRARDLGAQVEKAFTEHPAEIGETYLEHLWFTLRLTSRLIYSSVVLFLHGVFPFILTRTASNELDRIYTTLKARVPKASEDSAPDYQL